MPHEIRPAEAADAEAIKKIAVATELFSSEEVDMFDEMIGGYLDGSLEGHRWLVIDDKAGNDGGSAEDQLLAAAAYYAPEPFSDRLWNLYFLGVMPDRQGQGEGRALIAAVEAALRRLGKEQARVLLVETSGLPHFQATRDFYRSNGFHEEARIRQFYGPDDDKIVFWRSLVDV